MGRIVDEIVSIYIAEDKHTATAEKIARVQVAGARVEEQLEKKRAATAKATREEAAAERELLRVAEQGSRLAGTKALQAQREAASRANVARAILAETKARAALAKEEEKANRASTSNSSANRFRRGFGSTRLNLGGASPLLSQLAGGGAAGFAGAAAGVGIGALLTGITALTSAITNLAAAGLDATIQGIGMAASAAGDFMVRAGAAAEEYEANLARLTAITGDAASAQRKLAFAQAQAVPSPFTTKQLSEATTLLEAYGANSERLLPIVGKLGAAIGADDEKLQMFTRSIGALSTGKMIEADNLASMGMSKKDFVDKGIKFDGSGQLESSARETLTALEKIITERFGNIYEQTSKTAAAKRASLEDAGEQFLRAFGQGVLKAEGPVVDTITKVLNGFVQSGEIGKSVEKMLTGLAGAMPGEGGLEKFLVGGISKALAFVEMLATNAGKIGDYISRAWAPGVTLFTEGLKLAHEIVQRLQPGFMAVWHTVESIGNAIAGVAKMSAALDPARWMTDPIGTAKMLWDATQNFAKSTISSAQSSMDQQGFLDAMAMPLDTKNFDKAMGALGKVSRPTLTGYDSSRADAIAAGVAGAMGSPAQANLAPRGDFFSRSPESEKQAKADAQMESIAKNTAATADNTGKQIDVQRLLFGGGDRARAGIDIASVTTNAGARRSTGPIKIDIERSADTLKRGFMELLEDALPDVLRSLGWSPA